LNALARSRAWRGAVQRGRETERQRDRERETEREREREREKKGKKSTGIISIYGVAYTRAGVFFYSK